MNEDIETEKLRKKISELENKVEMYEGMLDAMPFHVFLKNKKYQYIFNNKMNEEANGVSRGGLIGKTDLDLWQSKGLAEDYIQSDESVLENKKGLKQYIPIFAKDVFFYQKIIKEPVFNKNDDLIGILGVIVSEESRNLNLYNQNNASCLVFDYIVDSQSFIVLQPCEEFGYLSKENLNNWDKIKSDYIFEDEKAKLENAYKKLCDGEMQVSLLINFFDSKKQLRLCKLELTGFYDLNNKLGRISGILRIVEEDNLKTEQMSVSVTSAKKRLSDLLGDFYDLCIFVSPESNYYNVLLTSELFKMLPKSGDLLNFSDYFYKRLDPNYLELVREIFAMIRNSIFDREKIERPLMYANKEGKFVEKHFRIFNLENEDGMILAFSK